MKVIRVGLRKFDVQAMYQKANTNAQRALLGYIIKGGYANNDIFGSAFYLLHTIESYDGIYVLASCVDTETAKTIVQIAEAAMVGEYDGVAFTEREIGRILQQFKIFDR